MKKFEFMIHTYVVFSDYNGCSSSPCENGGACVNAVNQYTCTCVGGYTGIHCQGRSWVQLCFQMATLGKCVKKV